jgi:hypothetical protein
MEVTLVAADIDTESRELGVLVYVVEEVEPRLGVKLSRAPVLDFLGVLSTKGKFVCSSLLIAIIESSATSMTSGFVATSPARVYSALAWAPSFTLPLPRFDLPESDVL